MSDDNTLYLTLKKKWFDMIASGEKREEYRELKPYWAKRLTNKDGTFKHFDVIIFRNGYTKEAPKITVHCIGITSGGGIEGWGAAYGDRYYVIKLGKVLSC